MSSKEGLRDRTLEYAQAAARDGVARAEAVWNVALPRLQQFGLRDLEVAKPFAKDTVARTRPLLPIWARDAPWSWWAGGWSIALILAASLRPRKASLKAAPQPAAKPSSPNVRSSSAAPPETPLADATSSPWVPLDFSPEGVKPTKKHNGKENTASTSNKPNESNEKKSEEAQLPVEASTEDLVHSDGEDDPAVANTSSSSSSSSSSTYTYETLDGLDAQTVLLVLKHLRMHPKAKLNWDEHVSTTAWKKVEFSSTGNELTSLQLAVVPTTSAANRKFDCELKCTLEAHLGPLLGSHLRRLNLEGNNGVSGNISALQACPNLEEVLLGVTACVGDISVFAHCPKVQMVSLGGGRGRLPITGDIAVFSNCPDLKSLKIMKAACMGDVSVFAHTPQLEHLFINKAVITGNVAVFACCGNLSSVTLSLTRVKGFLKSFVACPNLKRLNVRGANGVSGKADELQTALPLCTVVM